MKSLWKLFIAVFPLLVTASCAHKDSVREELIKRHEDLPSVSEIYYDNLASSATTMGIYWNAEPAINAGAISFKVIVSEDLYIYEEEGGVSNSKSYTVKVSSSPNDAIIATGLTAGQSYYVRVSAVYPGPHTSDPGFLLGDDGEPVAVVPGVGIL